MTEQTSSTGPGVAQAPSRRFGALEGVFTPTLLTILGVIMYLREGWVVGQVGLIGAWLIILLASIITACTALSLSSIATNVRLDAGGPYAIISRSLGLELGGSVGLPQYLSQAMAVAMYIFGLREGWLFIFPSHSALLVDLSVFALVFTVAMISASVAFRIQYIIMGVIAVSLVSAFGAFASETPTHAIEWWRGDANILGDTHFWVVFAVFFPATTGILAGANMSGELRDPRRSIPFGTLAAVAIGTAIYLVLAYWFARMASPDELRSNYNVMIERALFGPAVIAGLLGATLSSALSSLVGAPRILQALAATGVVPWGQFLAKRSSGEPRRAMVVTGAIVLGALLLRDLNVIAPLITLFFLITYGMINVVVLLEQRLAVVSFRPRLRVPIAVPLVGTVGCLFAMFIVNPTFSLVAIAVVVAVYGVLMRRKLRAPHGDVRSGLFLMLAEWAARRATQLPDGQTKAWKANLLVPVVDTDEVLGHFPLIVDLAKPYGSILLLGVGPGAETEDLRTAVDGLADDYGAAGVHTTGTVVESAQVSDGLIHAMQTLRSAFLRPNLLFLTPLESKVGAEELERTMRRAKENRMGVVLAALHPKTSLGRRKRINVWIRSQAPSWSFEESLHLSNLNLLVLIPYLLQRRWDAKLSFRCVVDEGDEDAARAYLAQMLEVSRVPEDAETVVVTGSFREAVASAAHADVNVFGLPNQGELALVAQMLELTHSACLFVRDSGEEDALV